jgi:hypothetical protein
MRLGTIPHPQRHVNTKIGPVNDVGRELEHSERTVQERVDQSPSVSLSRMVDAELAEEGRECSWRAGEHQHWVQGGGGHSSPGVVTHRHRTLTWGRAARAFRLTTQQNPRADVPP